MIKYRLRKDLHYFQEVLKMTQKTRRIVLYINLATLLAIAFITLMIALRFFDNPRIATQSFFNAAIDVLGTFVCAVLFYGCIGDRISEKDESARWFVMLIYILSVSFFNNILLWFCYFAEKAKIQWLVYFSPGRSTTDGQSGLCGVSG